MKRLAQSRFLFSINQLGSCEAPWQLKSDENKTVKLGFSSQTKMKVVPWLLPRMQILFMESLILAQDER